ncbi:MAG: tRNA (guanosine(37)-N1)-methyltransferase TrmD [Bacillota bacterium]
MQIYILTLFPEMFAGPFDASIIKRAREKGLIKIDLVNIRDFSKNKHRTVDDAPFGGGPGMVMAAEPVFEAVDWLKRQNVKTERIILLSPAGRPFNQALARELSREKTLILICGHYEGIDERVREHLVTEEISIGDYVLTGGELPAMVVVDAVARLLPGVLGRDASAAEESFSNSLLEYPHYTRPREYRGCPVPEVLLSGHHEQIRAWRRRQALLRTLENRPDLLRGANLTSEDKQILKEVLKKLQELNLE